MGVREGPPGTPWGSPNLDNPINAFGGALHASHASQFSCLINVNKKVIQFPKKAYGGSCIGSLDSIHLYEGP